MKMNVKAFALALGVLWSVSVLLMGLLAMVCSWALPFVDAVSVIYRGYTATVVGSVIGAVWAFFDGFIGGFFFAWLYNKFSK